MPRDQPGALRKIVDEERPHLLDLVVEGGRVQVVERDHPLFTAFVLEPVQGEGGIHELSAEFVAEVQEVCAEARIPVVVDEIQSGMGRTGSFLAATRLGLKGDYYTLAKSLGGGIAKSAVLLVRKPLYHGSSNWPTAPPSPRTPSPASSGSRCSRSWRRRRCGLPPGGGAR